MGHRLTSCWRNATGRFLTLRLIIALYLMAQALLIIPDPLGLRLLATLMPAEAALSLHAVFLFGIGWFLIDEARARAAARVMLGYLLLTHLLAPQLGVLPAMPHLLALGASLLVVGDFVPHRRPAPAAPTPDTPGEPPRRRLVRRPEAARPATAGDDLSRLFDQISEVT